MLDSLFYSTTDETITLTALLAAIGASLVLGLVISLVYLLTHKAEGYSGSFVITMIMKVILFSVLLSCLFAYVPLISSLGSGWRITICGVISAGLAAWLFPLDIKDSGDEQEAAG